MSKFDDNVDRAAGLSKRDSFMRRCGFSDWKIQLGAHLDPVKINHWFRHAEYFPELLKIEIREPSKPWAKHTRDWIANNYQNEMREAFGYLPSVVAR